MGEVENVAKLEVIGVSRNDKVETLAILGADDVKGLVDVVQEQWFRVESTECNFLNCAVISDILWRDDGPCGLNSPRDLNE